MKRPSTRLLFAITMLCSVSPAYAQVDARMLRHPDVSNTQIDKAIELILDAIKQDPHEEMTRPAYRKR